MKSNLLRTCNSRIRLSGANTRPVRGYEEKSSQLRTLRSLLSFWVFSLRRFPFIASNLYLVQEINYLLLQTFEDKYLLEILRRHKCRDQRDLPILLRFTRKCVELTWLMCVQEPPVVFDSLDHYDKFDTNCYKAFMKQGKTVDYYVWPALLLHEGGPLLAKGVAQGK